MIKNFRLLTALFSLSSVLLPAAGPKVKLTLPDFTKGDPIPEGASHDWNLGATGARGWIYSDKMESSSARQIAITKVAQDSPAKGILQKNDVILGISGKPFSYDPRAELGKALTLAESSVGQGKLSLIRWRANQKENVIIQLPVLGNYSATAPYDCPKSQRILEQGCEALAQEMAVPSYKANPIVRSLNALALLASGNEKYLPLVKKEAQWASAFKADSMATWYYGYAIMLLAEYQMATGDDSFLPGLRRLALEAAEGQSIVGTWGHKFAGDDGRLVGYGMMNAPGLPLTASLILATKAGVSDPKVARAIEQSTKLLRFYAGKGAVPYGDHSPWIQTHEDNGKCGMAAVLFNLNNEPKTAEFFSRMSLASHGSERDTGHTGNFFNILWAIPAVAQSGPQATGAWMKEFGGWYFDLARRHDGSFVHLGPPQARNDSYTSWDCTGVYLLAYAQPLKKIYLTGKDPGTIPLINSTEASDLIADGRGWSNKYRHDTYDQLSEGDLLKLLSRWSPIVRERAAIALSRKKDGDPVASLIKMLDSSDLETRYGACQALALLKKNTAEAVPLLKKNLQHQDLWLRVKAAEALAHIGKPAMSALPELLTMLAKGPSAEDPRAMEQRYLSFAVFGKMLRNTPDDIDLDLLRQAIVAGLKNEDGRARGEVGRIYNKLTYEEIKPILPAIHEAIAKPSPSGIMFASGVRLAGLELLANHRIAEGMPLCFEVMQITKWGKAARIPRCLNALKKYGAAAKPMLPKLKQLEKDLLVHREKRNLQKHLETLQEMIIEIENSTDSVELRRLN
ncbi:MAG: HEAT repeat protein [Paracoccaceae bacterium]|jgi:HEAT repeat protein